MRQFMVLTGLVQILFLTLLFLVELVPTELRRSVNQVSRVMEKLLFLAACILVV